jgi:hypothetical protein
MKVNFENLVQLFFLESFSDHLRRVRGRARLCAVVPGVPSPSAPASRQFAHRRTAGGVKKKEDGRRPTALQVGHPKISRKAVLGVARPQGV